MPNRFTDPIVVENQRKAFLELWNSDMPMEELLKASGNKNRRSVLARASRLKGMGYEVSDHRLSPKIAMKKDIFVESWNGNMTDREFQIKYRRPRQKLLDRAIALRKQGIEMKQRRFNNRTIAKSKPDYKPERPMMEEWELREVLGQIKRGVDRDIIAQLHATSRRYIQWIVDNSCNLSIAK